LVNLDTEVDINIACETIRINSKFSAKDSAINYELKTHKPLFDEGCPELLDQRKQVVS
jgi:hypothetical protein